MGRSTAEAPWSTIPACTGEPNRLCQPFDAFRADVVTGPTPPVPVLRLIGPKAARKSARRLLGCLTPSEHHAWQQLPAGPAVCVDARRFVYLSNHGVHSLSVALTDGAVTDVALTDGALVAIPASNAGPWPLCGLEPPSGAATEAELDVHSAKIHDLRGTDRIGSDYPLPALFAVADASLIVGRPLRVGDLASGALVIPSVWCHTSDVPKITLAMIVKNEAAGIERVIRSVSGLVDEMVVYDTGSTDDTVRLARLACAMVRSGHWDDDFSRARNESFAMSRADWILVLDGDDEFVADAEERSALRSLVDQLGPTP